MAKAGIKKILARAGASIMAAVIAASAIVSAGAQAVQHTPSGDTVIRISNPDGKPGEVDGLIGDREVSYGWSMAERNGYIYIGGWRNTVGVVIKHYLESALVASGKMDSETVWALTNIITNGEVPYPSNPNGGVLVKMDRQNPGEFEILAEMQDPFRHVAKYENDLYFATYIGASGNDPKIYKLDENDVLTEVYTTAQGASMRANCVYRDRLYFAGTCADEKQKEGEPTALAVIQKHANDDGWDKVADYRDFAYTSVTVNEDGSTTETEGNYGFDSFVSATAGSPFWDMTAYNDEIYATIPNMLGYVVFKGHPAKEGEEANPYGWVWEEVIGRDKNSPNNQGLSKTDKLGFTDAANYSLGYQSVVGSLGVYDGQLYAYDIDHTISAELAGIQGMLMMISDPGNANLAAYLKPLVTTMSHPQTLWRMDKDTNVFSEVEGFTALTKNTTNEYVWKHGVYNGEFYISTMDSKVIYNYLTRITGGSWFEMTPEEKERQINYIVDFVTKLLAKKLTEKDVDEMTDNLLATQQAEGLDLEKYEELKAKLQKTFSEIASLEQWQLIVLLSLDYMQTRGLMTEETAAVSEEIKAMFSELSKLDLSDWAAVAIFSEKYSGTFDKLKNALLSVAAGIDENPEMMLLTDEEKAQLKDVITTLTGAIDQIVGENFANEIAKIKDLAQVFVLYSEISARVAIDVQGFDIFKTADGDNWEIVTNDGFGDKFNYGALRFVTTEEGMYITTANPFYGAQLYLLKNCKEPTPETTLEIEDPTFRYYTQTPEPVVFNSDSASTWATVRADGKLIEGGATIENGAITIAEDIIKAMPEGENTLTLTAEEGSAEVTVIVIDGARGVKGDVNLDGKFDIQDATELQRFLAEFIELDDEALANADFNGDNRVNILDVTAMQRAISALGIYH